MKTQSEPQPETKKRTRVTFSEEQKNAVKKLLKEKKTHNAIFDATGVGKGTIAKIAATMKEAKPEHNVESGVLTISKEMLEATKTAALNRIDEIKRLTDEELPKLEAQVRWCDEGLKTF